MLSHFLLNLRKISVDSNSNHSRTGSASVVSDLHFTNILGDMGSIEVAVSSFAEEQQLGEHEGPDNNEYELEERQGGMAVLPSV